MIATVETDSHPTVERLSAFAWGRLSEAELEQLCKHLNKCETCRRLVEAVPDDEWLRLLRQVAPAKGTSSVVCIKPGYEILELVAKGGMGIVWRARQTDLGRIVALKQIKDDRLDSQHLARFRLEALAMARLHHPNIVQVFDVGEQDGVPYIACEFVSGGTLANRLPGKPLSAKAACKLVLQLARAVQAAHDQSVIHRDLKPSNVLLATDSPSIGDVADESFWDRITPKVSDFGLAKHLGEDDALTHTGTLLGTPEYMAPEQAVGRIDLVDARTDVHALGVILYEALTGRRPFQGASVVETLDLVRQAQPVPPKLWLPRLSRDCDTIVLKCLEKEPQRRYQSAGELADDIEHHLAGNPIRARPTPIREWIIKWAKRRPAEASLIVLAITALIAFVDGITWHNRRLRVEVDRANAGEERAVASFRKGYETLDHLAREVADSSYTTAPWMEMKSRLHAGTLDFYYSAMEGADTSIPNVRLSQAMSLVYAGSLHRLDGHLDEATHDLARGAEILEALCEKYPSHRGAQIHLSSCYFNQGAVAQARGDAGLAERLFERSLAMGRSLIPFAAEFPRLKSGIAQREEHLAELRLSAGRLDEAERCFEAALELRREIADSDPRDVENRKLWGRNGWQLVDIYIRAKRYDDAEALLHESGRRIRPSDDAPMPIWVTTELANVSRWQAVLEVARDQPRAALQHLSQAIAVVSKIHQEAPTEATARAMLHNLYRTQAVLLERDRRPQEAMLAWQLALDFATSDERLFCRAERAYERAQVGDHQFTFAEANEVAAHPAVSGRTLIYLARAWSRAFDAIERDAALAASGKTDRLNKAACQGVQCLARGLEGLPDAAAQLAALQTEPDLAPLVRSKAFQDWRSVHAQAAKAASD